MWGRVLIDERTEPDEAIVQHIKIYADDLSKQLAKPCGFSDVDLDCRFESIRAKETNIGNFISDVCRTEFKDCDFALINSGCLRSNSICPKGQLTLRLCADLIPGVDHIVVL